jgi:cell division protein FtsN
MQRQRGGTFLGFVLGLVIGLGIAFGIALYVTKVPLPFLSKGQTRSADQNDAEAKKNKDWDPNARITGKQAPKAAAPEEAASAVVPPLPPPAPAAPTTTATPTPPAAAADPIGALANAKAASAAMPTGQIFYYVQVGAFRSMDDAQSQRAKLSLTGVEAAVTEREQGGRPIFRVRVGPFEKIEDAERSKDKLDKSGTDTVLMKVQR